MRVAYGMRHMRSICSASITTSRPTQSRYWWPISLLIWQNVSYLWHFFISYGTKLRIAIEDRGWLPSLFRHQLQVKALTSACFAAPHPNSPTYLMTVRKWDLHICAWYDKVGSISVIINENFWYKDLDYANRLPFFYNASPISDQSQTLYKFLQVANHTNYYSPDVRVADLSDSLKRNTRTSTVAMFSCPDDQF